MEFRHKTALRALLKWSLEVKRIKEEGVKAPVKRLSILPSSIKDPTKTQVAWSRGFACDQYRTTWHSSEIAVRLWFDKVMTGGARKKVAASSAASNIAVSAKVDLSEEQKTDVREAFNLFDSGSTGFIDTKDLKVKYICMFMSCNFNLHIILLYYTSQV